MNRTSHAGLAPLMGLAVLMLALSGVAFAQEQPVRVKVDGLAPQVAEQVRRHAAEGKSSLVAYVHRTRMIHGLRIEDLLARVE